MFRSPFVESTIGVTTAVTKLVTAEILLRKEVIQPQLPLRLPCYDFTPITGHTLGSCVPYGLAHRLLVQQTFVV